MPNFEKLSTVIDGLYDSVLDESTFSSAIAVVGEQLRSEHGTVFAWNTRCEGAPEPVGVYSTDRPTLQSFVADYREHFAAHDPTLAIAGHFPQGWFVDTWHLSARERQGNAMLQGCLRPKGFSGWAALEVKSGERMWAFSFLRSNGVRDFDSDDIAAGNHLAPHLSRVLLMREKMGRLRTEMAVGHSALDLLTFPVWVVDAESRVVFHNRAVETLVASGQTALRQKDLKLVAFDGQGQSWLERALRAATVHTPKMASSQLVAGQSGMRYPVTVAPLSMQTASDMFNARPLAAVVAPTHRPPSVQDLLISLYGFTKAETRIANAILDGMSVAEMADAFGVQVSTVQTQIKAILAKTGLRKQVHLATLLSRLGAIRS